MPVMDRVEKLLRNTLVDPVPRDHQQPDHEFRRRRVVAAITVVVGGVLLGYSLSLEPGDGRFYVATVLLATTWVVGSFASGPLHLGYIADVDDGRLMRPVLQPLAVGVAAVAVFTVGAWIVGTIPPLRDAVIDVLDHARFASLPAVLAITILNGVAEEVFFRGALFAAIGRTRPVLISTLVYGLTTVATGNFMLVFAALVLGVLVGLQRRVTGGVLAPMITHVTWSVSMLFLLPWVLDASA
jgi:membrane protease YdiL (CAAX protease family)